MDTFDSSQSIRLLNFEAYGIYKSISDILLEIRYLSRFFPTHPDETSSPNQEHLDIHSTVCSIFQRLLQIEPDTEPGQYAAGVTECCRLAAAIFLFFLLENHYPDPTRLINSLLHKLQNALGSIIPRSLNENKLLVWVFAVGGVAALDLTAERDWFVGHLTELVAELGLISWDKGKDCLQLVIWIDAMDEQPFHELWNEALTNITHMTTKAPFCAAYC